MKIFFIGIGGKGLNGIAQICLEKNYKVSGVDKNPSPETQKLIDRGAKIYYEHNSENLSPDTEIVVRTSIVEECPEIKKAELLGIPVLKRSQFLHQLIKNNFKISVAGSHGKSTTTALIGLSLINNNFDPTIYGGAYIKELDAYNVLGRGKMAVVEACEYDRSFYDLIGDVSIITRAEKSHLEYYKDEHDMLSAFEYFIKKHNEQSLILINGDDVNLLRVSAGARAKIVTFGFGDLNDYQIINLNLRPNSTQFSLVKNSVNRVVVAENLKINLPGDYNALNFASVLALFYEMNLNLDGVKKTAETFRGVGRRFEIHETEEGPILVDDFAHHPTQVQNLVTSLRQFFPTKKICTVFQPRQFHLIKSFLKEYGSSFKESDHIIVTDILPALGDRPEDIKNLKTDDVVQSINYYSNRPVAHKKNFKEIVEYIFEKFGRDVIVATIGAGDIYKLRHFFKLKKI